MGRLKKIALVAETGINRLSKITGILGIIFLLIMMMLTVADVFLRFSFNRPIAGTMELSTYMMVLVCFFGISWCALDNKHVQVSIIYDKLKPKAQAILDSLLSLMVISICIILSLKTYTISLTEIRLHSVSSIMRIPTYPFYWVVVFGFVLMALVMIPRLVHSVHKAVKK